MTKYPKTFSGWWWARLGLTLVCIVLLLGIAREVYEIRQFVKHRGKSEELAK